LLVSQFLISERLPSENPDRTMKSVHESKVEATDGQSDSFYAQEMVANKKILAEKKSFQDSRSKAHGGEAVRKFEVRAKRWVELCREARSSFLQ
jgi:hypothetical protein